MSARQDTPPSSTRKTRSKPMWISAMGSFIFLSRWLQAPLYLGLMIAQLIYVIVFMVELWHLAETVIADPLHISEAYVMLAVLGLIDVVMIANLLIMVIIGGYETFVSRLDLENHPDQPEWLSHVNANVLKTKLAMAIIGISSIHLLKTFIEVADLGARETESVTGNVYTSDGVLWQVVIHLVFIISAVALAWIDNLTVKQDLARAGISLEDARLAAKTRATDDELSARTRAEDNELEAMTTGS